MTNSTANMQTPETIHAQPAPRNARNYGFTLYGPAVGAIGAAPLADVFHAETARRLAAAWNICKGYGLGELESGAVGLVRVRYGDWSNAAAPAVAAPVDADETDDETAECERAQAENPGNLSQIDRDDDADGEGDDVGRFIEEQDTTREAIARAVEAAMNAGALVIQKCLGVTTGDTAAQFFDGADESGNKLREVFGLYFAFERERIEARPPFEALCVDGHEFDDEESSLMGDGRFAPFYIFDARAQNNLPHKFATRADAEAAVAALAEDFTTAPNERTAEQMPPELARQGYRLEVGDVSVGGVAKIGARFWSSLCRGWPEAECGDDFATAAEAIEAARKHCAAELARGADAFKA